MTNWYQRLHETANPLEVAWTLVALVGLSIAVWALLDAWWDRRALIFARLNGGRMIVANGAVRREVFRMVYQGVFIMIGAFAGLQAPANPDTPITHAGVAIAAGLIVVELAVAASSVTDRLERVRLMGYIDAYEMHRVRLEEREAVRVAVEGGQMKGGK